MILTRAKIKVFQALGLRSQMDLARRLGMHENSARVKISHVLNGERVNPKLRKRIARLARRPVTYFWPRRAS